MTFKKAIGLLLILILLAAGGVYLLMVEKEDDKRMSTLYSEVEPLERERESLIQEKKNLETEYAQQMRDYGTLEIMFRKADAQIISDVWPVMRSRGVVGVVPFSFVEIPGYYNKLKWEDLRTLIADGWGVYLLYEYGGSDPTAWLNGAQNYFRYNKIDFPTTIYFVNNNYDPSMDEALINAGIRTVVTNASDGRSNTVTDVTGPLWHTGVMNWGYTTSATDIELLGRTDGSNLALLMTLNEIWDPNKNKGKESEEKAAFIETLDSWQEMLYDDSPLDELEQVGPTPNIYLNTNDENVLHDLYLDSLTPEQQLLLPKFRCVNFEKALDLHLEMAGKKNDMGFEKKKKENELDHRISELDEQISSIYEQYSSSQKDIMELLK
ncbi:MAG: hypothetical protein IKS55_10560 [Oscillospiraceae bacterium]|nr:hypothetical protein [Oscillospiraceae bacterium]